MSEEQDRKDDEQPAESDDFAYSIAWGSESDDGADLCPDCRGKGRVLLLINTIPCQTCNGNGFLTQPTATSWTTITRFQDSEEGGEMISHEVIES